MDGGVDDVSSSMNGVVIDADHSCRNVPPLQPDRGMADSASASAKESIEDCDFSDVVLKYINQILMEEDMVEKTCMFHESAALQAAEKSLYEVIGEKYPPSSDRCPLSIVESNHGTLDETSEVGCITPKISSSSVDWNIHHHGPESSATASQSGVYSESSNGFADSPMSTLQLPQIFTDRQSMSQFMKGIEEASKFLPNDSSLTFDVTTGWKSIKDNDMNGNFSNGSRGKKNPHPDSIDLDEPRSNKQSALSIESTVSSEMFDMVLLGSGEGDAALRESLQSAQHQDGELKGPNRGKSRGKKQGKKRVVDLRTLLTLCAQAVAAGDQRSANDLLGQIRQHSSPTGDGMQRMAHYFADGLQARLAGSGTEIYKALMARLPSAADILKAYHLYLTVCPFKKVSNFFANKTIMNLAENAKRLHIVDFGIRYGFQWPCLIERLSSQKAGPPRLRITGIDLPQPGFRPTKRVEETGRRLENYAKTFGVPFEFKAIAQRWETIQLQDLSIDPDEVLVVNCMYRLRNLLDETVMADNPRDIVLGLIKKMKPNVFVLGMVSGAYNAPFFITRFREALFHYSTSFDLLEANVPRDIPERKLIEREIYGWEAMNTIACEGAERIERPETYKQCQVRVQRAGFVQLPLNKQIVKTAKDRVKSYYHKDFVIDENGQWLLQGWKGRILYALSSWKPAC